MTAYRAVLGILMLYVALDLALPMMLGASELAPDAWTDSGPGGRDRAAKIELVVAPPPTENLPPLRLRPATRPAPRPRQLLRQAAPLAKPRARSMLVSAPLEPSDPH
jgi:hypothetical protein